MTDGDREFETDETIQRIETKSDPVIGPVAPLGTPAAEEAVVTSQRPFASERTGRLNATSFATSVVAACREIAWRSSWSS